MTIPTLYGFITDDALKVASQLDLTNSYDQGYGVLSGETRNYLVNEATLGDTRTSRLAVLDNSTPKGSIALLFDQDRFETQAYLKSLSTTDVNCIFNIIERCLYRQQYNDSNIEAQLTVEDAYKGYVAESYAHSIDQGKVKITNSARITTEILVDEWCSFEYNNSTVNFKIKVWLQRDAFKTQYPYTTITKVIPPYDPQLLVDPAALLQTGNLAAVTASAGFIFDSTNLEMVARDQNGVYTYRTKYVIDSATTATLPFALAYCGPNVPSTLDCRRAIRAYLEDATALKTEYLQALFPDLYISARFYLIPLWDLYYQAADRAVYTSCVSLNKINERLPKVLPDVSTNWVNMYAEILTNSQNKMLTVSVPDELNDELFSIAKLHPTYQDYSTQNADWKYMTADTQEFAGKLMRCMAVLQGDAVSNEFVTTKISNRVYLAFTTATAEYLVMTQDTYLNLVE